MKKINIKSAGLKVASTGVGAYAAVKLDKIGFIGKQSLMVRGLIKIGLGAFLPALTKQKPGSMVDHAGNGLIAVGALQLASKFDASATSISGVDSLPTVGKIYFDEAYTNGVGDVDGVNDVMGGSMDYAERG